MAPKRMSQTSAKRPSDHVVGRGVTPMRLRYDEDVVPRQPIAARDISEFIPRLNRNHSETNESTNDLVFMTLDVVEERFGAQYRIWGITQEGHSVLVTVSDFHPYFYIATPTTPDADPIDWSSTDSNYIESQLSCIQMLLNSRAVPQESQIQSIELVHRQSIMYYRPDAPGGQKYLRLEFGPGCNAKQIGNMVLKCITARPRGGLRDHGFVWRDQQIYEHEVSPIQRFLADVPVSAGAWLVISAAAKRNPRREVLHVSHAFAEVECSWKNIVCLTPDATQLSDARWDPLRILRSEHCSAPSQHVKDATSRAKAGAIAPLRILALDVCHATKDGINRTPVADNGDPIVAISCRIVFQKQHDNGALHSMAQKSTKDSTTNNNNSNTMDVFDGDQSQEGDFDDEEENVGGAQILKASPEAVAGAPRSSGRIAADREDVRHENTDATPRPIVFVLFSRSSDAATLTELSHGAHVVLCNDEAELLLTWHDYVMKTDPDIIAVFQVGQTLQTIAQRFAALQLHGGKALSLSRLVADHATPIEIRRITMYSAAWVRRETSRMSSTSNQETFKADIDGRMVIDVLRQVLTNSNLASFSFVDCVQSLLGETLEVLGPHTLDSLSRGGQIEDAMRLARYSLRRSSAVVALLEELATVPEAIEMARATGLTISQVMYNAQMIRTWSLLLRTCQRQGVILPSRPETGPVTEHTFILHPVEAGTTGLYQDTHVAILDFASLYPSIFRAYNLCYSTLLYDPKDAESLPADSLVTSPTGAMFVKPSVRQGILPSILEALVSARAATRTVLASTPLHAKALRAVLESRQKALKVTANALYGFTGAQASPLQCAVLADCCLAYGAQSCRRAKEVLERLAIDGELGPAGVDARVIYGHTDSLFLLMPRVNKDDIAGAIQVGKTAAQQVSKAFPAPIELKFERVCMPFLLLHVNRYAGRAFEGESDISSGGSLLVKGLRSLWRQTPQFLRTLLHRCLVKILMQSDIQGAVAIAEAEIRRLLSGNVDINELIMTGGLWRVGSAEVERAAKNASLLTTPDDNTLDKKRDAGSSEIRGPHASLAVRLAQRDPGRSFVLGERLSYILVTGHKLQDEAAEDPLTTARSGLRPDYDLYWNNKVKKPLSEVFATCLNPNQLQSLLSGPHTLVKIDKVANHSTINNTALGPTSPSPGSSKRVSTGGKQQTGMMQFFKASGTCLGCKRALVTWKGPLEEAPGLCNSCANESGTWESVYLNELHSIRSAESKITAAISACTRCHSGCLSQPVVCDNGECPVTYARIGSQEAQKAAQQAMKRLNISSF